MMPAMMLAMAELEARVSSRATKALIPWKTGNWLNGSEVKPMMAATMTTRTTIIRPVKPAHSGSKEGKRMTPRSTSRKRM